MRQKVVVNAKRPTQADVARKAGVSRGTVSLVLNSRTSGRIPISEETRLRVQQVAADLGYAPNPVGKMLAQGNNYLIGVFVYQPEFPYEADDFFFPYLTGIQREASAQDYNVLLFTRHKTAGEAAVYKNAMNSLLLADGSVILGDNPNRQELRRLHDEGYPFVYIGRREIPGCRLNWVTHDYQIGAAQAAQHLLDLGHRRMAFVSAHPGREPQEDKLAGCRLALSGCPGVELFEYRLNEHDAPAAFLAELFEQRVTAILCDFRIIFEDMLQLLYEAGLKVPQDMSILSMTTAANHPLYPLRPSHVQLDQRGVGVAATRLLVAIIDHETREAQQILLPCRFVPGETTGPPRD